MKYSLTKQVTKEALVELFMMLSDSFDENIPDILWENSEFEVKITEPNLKTKIDFISTKKGGEFTVNISWITDVAKKQMAKETEKKNKEKLAKGGAAAAKATPKSKAKKKVTKPVELVSDEELWSDEEDWTVSGDDSDWDSEDYDDAW